MTLAQFVAKYNGKSVNVDNSFGPQCWDLAAEYSRSVVGVPGKVFPFGLPTGDGCAAGVYKNFKDPLPKHYKRIQYTKGLIPKAGDIIVWNYNLPGSGGAGHIGMVLTATATAFTSFDQNWGGQFAHKVNHNYNYVIGILRPLKNIPPPAPTYLKWVRATGKPWSNVRSKPTTLSPLAGSKRLPYGTPFRVKGVVKGQNVNGSDKWYVSTHGNYVHTSVAK